MTISGSGGGNWTLRDACRYLQDGYDYPGVYEGRRDNAGNVENAKAGVLFKFDTSSPTAGVVLPSAGNIIRVWRRCQERRMMRVV